MSELKSILGKINNHSRDDNIVFFEEGHKYDILNDMDHKYTSVTTWNHSHFPKFDSDKIIENIMKGKKWNESHKYWGKSKEDIKALWKQNADSVSSAGTDLHYHIECFMNNEKMSSIKYTHSDLYNYYIENQSLFPNTSLEWNYFIQFVKDHPSFKPYRTEWIVYDEEVKLAGSIDMVYENDDGTLSIYDWKRSKDIKRVNDWNKYALTPSICEMPDSNFWHYALQLNTYKYILEKHYNKTIRELFLVRLHPDAEEKNYELIKLPNLTKQIKLLFQELYLQKNNI